MAPMMMVLAETGLGLARTVASNRAATVADFSEMVLNDEVYETRHASVWAWSRTVSSLLLVMLVVVVVVVVGVSESAMSAHTVHHHVCMTPLAGSLVGSVSNPVPEGAGQVNVAPTQACVRPPLSGTPVTTLRQGS